MEWWRWCQRPGVSTKQPLSTPNVSVARMTPAIDLVSFMGIG